MSDTPTGEGPLPPSPEPTSRKPTSQEPASQEPLRGEVPTDRGGDDAAALRADEFVAALPAASRGSDRNDAYARAGMVAMVVGLVAAVLAAILSQLSSNPLDQSTQISLGIAGLAATCFGGVIFLRYSMGDLLRFWLLRILAEQHRDDSDPTRRSSGRR